MSRLIDLTGQKLGYLTVIKRIKNNQYGHTRWLCKCDCGKETVQYSTRIRSGQVKSCGCMRGFKHGHARSTGSSPTYKSWEKMICRCYNKNYEYYNQYGGRGIKVCQRWHKFENFLEDMGERLPNTSIDRINNNGNYKPTNCRWSTNKEQSQNTRRNRNFTWKGETYCLAVWCRKLNLKYNKVLCRIIRGGWSYKRALELE